MTMQRGKAVAFLKVLIFLFFFMLFISYYTYQKEVRKTKRHTRLGGLDIKLSQMAKKKNRKSPPKRPVP